MRMTASWSGSRRDPPNTRLWREDRATTWRARLRLSVANNLAAAAKQQRFHAKNGMECAPTEGLSKWIDERLAKFALDKECRKQPRRQAHSWHGRIIARHALSPSIPRA